MKELFYLIPIFLLTACSTNEVKISATEVTTVATSVVQQSSEETITSLEEETKKTTETEKTSETKKTSEIEKTEETTIAVAEIEEVQIKKDFGYDPNGRPYLDPAKYATWEQQPVDENKIIEGAELLGEKIYQYMYDYVHGNMTEKLEEHINRYIEELKIVTEQDKEEYQKGQVFTWGADGKPIEAPPGGKYDEIMNPNTGLVYVYLGRDGKWISDENNLKEIETARAMRDGLMDAQGNTNVRHLTDEEAREIAAGIARAMGK